MYETWLPEGETAAVGKYEYPPLDTEKLWEEFSARAARIASCNAITVSDNAVMPGNGNIAGISALAYSALASLRLMIGDAANNGGAEDAYAPGAWASSLAFDHWQFDRRLWDVLQSYGANAEEARRITGIMRAFLRRIPVKAPYMASNEKEFNPRHFASWLIEENYSTDDFRTLLGINRFDDASWFNKEGFEAALFYGGLFAAVETGMADRVTRAREIFLQAEAGSGYRLDRFIDLLANEEAGRNGCALENTAKEKTTKGKKK
jgi:hypothetical protein